MHGLAHLAAALAVVDEQRGAARRRHVVKPSIDLVCGVARIEPATSKHERVSRGPRIQFQLCLTDPHVEAVATAAALLVAERAWRALRALALAPADGSDGARHLAHTRRVSIAGRILQRAPLLPRQACAAASRENCVRVRLLEQDFAHDGAFDAKLLRKELPDLRGELIRGKQGTVRGGGAKLLQNAVHLCIPLVLPGAGLGGGDVLHGLDELLE
mmetsp:Transcript_8625/g.35156  ORF Transcript_8625/g.35156 Transcript_8625/m.35156 type:complete len:215 (+) Transcript_8625:1427-2071(+)